MTAIMPEQDVDWAQLFDFEPDIPCDLRKVILDCPNQAIYTITMRCCGHVYFSCQKCYDDMTPPKDTIRVTCLQCNTKFDKPTGIESFAIVVRV